MDDDFHTAHGWHLPTLPSDVLGAFLDAVPAATAILNHRADVIGVNATWRRFAEENGGDPEGWRGKNYLWACHGGDPDALAVGNGIAEVLAGTRRSFQHEYPCHGDGVERWFRCLVSALPSDQEGKNGAAVMHVDITEQKVAERMALAASRAKSEFLASLSHELRTPLNAVIGFSEMMMIEVWGPLGDPRYGGYARDIHSSGKHLLALINEVLDLSKVEAGKLELRETSVAVGEVASQALHLMREPARRGDITLNLTVAEPLPPLFADCRLVHQILLNLLSNAIKFTPPGGSVTAEVATTPDGWLRLAVRDTGIGIAPEDIAHVLEPFGQVDSEQARLHSSQSTGLGLPLCKRFVELHGGRLEVASQPDCGTSVAALFPPERLTGVRPS